MVSAITLSIVRYDDQTRQNFGSKVQREDSFHRVKLKISLTVRSFLFYTSTDCLFFRPTFTSTHLIFVAKLVEQNFLNGLFDSSVDALAA